MGGTRGVVRFFQHLKFCALPWIKRISGTPGECMDNGRCRVVATFLCSVFLG